MIIFKNELPIDHEESIKHIVYSWAKDMFEHDKEMGTVPPNMDYCIECSWNSVMEHLQCEDLHVEICGDATKMAFANCDYVK